jgi:hypothetical protein
MDQRFVFSSSRGSLGLTTVGGTVFAAPLDPVGQLVLAHFGGRQRRRWAAAISTFTRSRAHHPNSLGESQKESKKESL